jgi:hypothetical protein
MRAPLFVFCLCLLLVGVAPAADSLNVRLVGMCDTPDAAYAVAANGGYAYVAADVYGLRVISLADPANPVEVGSCGASYAHDVAVRGNYAYVAAYHEGLCIDSIADPAHPTEVGFCDTPGHPECLDLSGDYVYIADSDSDLTIVSVSDPKNPVIVGRCDLPGWANAVAVSGDYAYVTSGSGLRIVSIADPARPTEVGYCDTVQYGGAVALYGGYACVADEGEGVWVISVADPAQPVVVAYLPILGALDVHVSGEYAYVADCDSGLRVFSLANPTQPLEVGHYIKQPCMALGVYADSDYVYLAAGLEGLWILQFQYTGLEESRQVEVRTANVMPTVVRGVLTMGRQLAANGSRQELLDAAGRKVMDLGPGPNDVSGLAPGVYFVRSEPSAVGRQPLAVAKVIISE